MQSRGDNLSPHLAGSAGPSVPQRTLALLLPGSSADNLRSTCCQPVPPDPFSGAAL